ncbi:hypothetical protein QYE76_028067 [Lolium multiflorum]|uniref:Glycosyltransferase family 92 protein n=1 Tax=Lolium multiflorum TaxID=4521 RepID=A0AAD8QNK5_LOLMU|nr:hypothetical protein QYE76_028067 [Lolium multiflorum]
MQSRRQHAAAILSVMALLFFVCIIPAGLIACVSQRRLPLAVSGGSTTTVSSGRQSPLPEAVLLPEWQVLVLLRQPNNATTAAPGPGNGTCVFRDGVSSPARSLGWLPASGRHAYTCIIPEPVRLHYHHDAPAPLLVLASSRVITADDGALPAMLKWSDRIVYESAVIDGGDVLVFAKGVNTRKKVNRAAQDIRCLYYHGDAAGNAVASLPATTSAQQVFRCPPPPPETTTTPAELRVTLVVAGEEEPIPSLATYDPTRHHAQMAPGKKKKRLICACTMIRDMAKFLREWVVYHAAVGVDRFYVYDNGSEDDLADQTRRLTSAGFDISTRTWPWPKTQEAALSHGAAVHGDACEWMVFIDADEFIFSPHWARSENPAKQMLRSVVASVKQDVGQVSLWCADFGPSGRTAHPEEGVTQGYTCRRKTMERRKSFVRLTAVDRSLVNSIHTFTLKPGFQAGWNTRVRVNHYKYQAWEEFKVKFHRRAPTYTADWTEKVELGSNDRTPGLGFEPVEPTGWPQKFCDVNDTLLRDVTRRWFGVGFGNNFDRPQIAGTNPGS